ncbi:MAG: hypothetical protein ACTH5W_18535 [Providencia sp.]|uniref:hypothetical protein n=1 Tax=Providencia sp. TaxID=589 RepID=UPI003F99DA35
MKPKNSKKLKVNIIDIRMQRPIVVSFTEDDKENATIITMLESERFKFNNSMIDFHTPNNVALFLSSAKKELVKSKSIYGSLFGKLAKLKNTKHKSYSVSDKDLPRLYNYFESIQLAIISAYTAIESFANIAIPKNYEYHRLNSKKIKEIYTKEQIERHIKTSEKLDKILPDILKCESPKGNKLWEDFKEIENFRNDIIHPKTSIKSKNISIEDSAFLCKLISDDFINKIYSAFKIIEYFCNQNTSNPLFPLGFGKATFEPIESKIDNIEKVQDASEFQELPT